MYASTTSLHQDLHHVLCSCADCPSGTFTDRFDQSKCTRCPEFFYQNEAGRTSCKRCPTGMLSISNILPRGTRWSICSWVHCHHDVHAEALDGAWPPLSASSIIHVLNVLMAMTLLCRCCCRVALPGACQPSGPVPIHPFSLGRQRQSSVCDPEWQRVLEGHHHPLLQEAADAP